MSKSSVSDKIRLSLVRMLASSKVLSLLEEELFKGRGVISRYMFMPGPVLREPEWNLELLQDICDQSFVMEMITRTLTQEVARPGLEIKPRFVHKCSKCGSEYQSEIKECQECKGTEFRGPAPSERKVLDEILKRPNATDDWDRIIRTIVEDDLKLGNWWLSVTYQDVLDPETKKIEKKVSEIYVEDPRWLRIVADEKGRIRSDQYFCPKCYQKDVHYTLKPEEIESGETPRCPICQGPLTMAGYLQEVHGEIRSRWGVDEMIHGSSTQRLPELYGRPRPLSVWKWLIMLRMMLDYNTEIYSTGYVSGFLVFEGLDQGHVNSIKAQIEKDIEAKQIIDPVTGEMRPSLRVRQAWIGTGALGEKPLKAEFIESMPDPEEMQSLDWFKFGIEKVTSVFGVTPVFVSIIESGRAGNNPRMQLDVQNRTIQEIQRSVVSALNHQLLERMKIYDWELTFKDIELRDELRQVQIHEIRARAAERWLAGGFQVKIDPNTGDLIVSGEGKPPAESPPEARGVPGPHISEESGAILEKSRFFSKAKPTIPGGPEHTEPDWTRLAIKEERSLARKLRAILLHYRDRKITREEALKLGEETITKHRPTLEEIALTKYNQMLRRMLPARERRGFESLKELPPEALRRITAVLEGALTDFRSILGDAQSQA